MPDHGHPADTELVERGPDPARVSRDVVPAGGAGRAPMAEQIDTNNTKDLRQSSDHWIPPQR